MRKTAVAIAVFLVISVAAYMTTSKPVWVSSEISSQDYEVRVDDHAYSLVATSDGGFAIAGSTILQRGLLFGTPVSWLVKTDAFGNMEWNWTNEGASAYSLVETSDFGLAMAGFGVWASDFWLVKTDMFGNVVWNYTYGGTNVDQARSLVETFDGGFALAGYTSILRDEIWLVKTEPYGNMKWSQTYGGANLDSAYSLVELSAGGFAIAGLTSSFGAEGLDFWLVKTDNYGNIEWNRTYGGADYDHAYSLIATSNGGFAIAGSTFSFGAGNADIWLVKTDAYGVVEWNQTYGRAGHDGAYSLVETSDGGFGLAGYTYPDGAQYADFWLVKTDMNGNMEWNQTYGGAGFEEARSLVKTSDGGFALAGSKVALDKHGADFWLVKTDAQGNMEWSQTYGRPVPTQEPTPTPQQQPTANLTQISILSPENTSYIAIYDPFITVPLIFATNASLSWVGYSLDGGNNLTATNGTVIVIPAESRSLTLYTNDTSGNWAAPQTVYYEIVFNLGSEEEPFPVVPVVAAVVVVAVAAVGTLRIYFKKRRRDKPTLQKQFNR